MVTGFSIGTSSSVGEGSSVAAGFSASAGFSISVGSIGGEGSSVAAGFSVSAGSSVAAASSAASGFSRIVCSSEVAATSVASEVSILAASGIFPSNGVLSVVERGSPGGLSSTGVGSLPSADPSLAGTSSVAVVLPDAACWSARVFSSDGIDSSVGVCVFEMTSSDSVVIAVSSVIAESFPFDPISDCRGSSTAAFSINSGVPVTAGGSCGGLAASLLSSDIGAGSELGSEIDSVGCGAGSVGVSSTVLYELVPSSGGSAAGVLS